jgi:hypothetical protein
MVFSHPITEQLSAFAAKQKQHKKGSFGGVFRKFQN